MEQSHFLKIGFHPREPLLDDAVYVPATVFDVPDDYEIATALEPANTTPPARGRLTTPCQACVGISFAEDLGYR